MASECRQRNSRPTAGILVRHGDLHGTVAQAAPSYHHLLTSFLSSQPWPALQERDCNQDAGELKSKGIQSVGGGPRLTAWAQA